MAVPGRKLLCEHGSEEFIENTCKPCEEEGKYTAADGLCQECEEIMCLTCFRHHKKGKFCKDHVLTDLKFSNSKSQEKSISDEGLGRCQKHLKDFIKFFCPTHEQVGCGDCMILEHKSCKVEYIPDKAINFRNSKDCEIVVNDVKACSNQSQECLSAIQTNRDVAEAVHAHVIADAEAFRDEIVNHVNKLTADICKKATDIKSKSINNFGILEKDASDILHEISSMEETLQSQQDQPNKLFVTSVLNKQKLQSLKEKINATRMKNKTTEYNFQQDDTLKRAVMRCNDLGVIHRCSGKEKNTGKWLETSQSETKHAIGNIPKPLLERTLRVDNLHVDGDILSSGPMVHRNGVYIGNIKMTSGCYFEVEIIRSGGSVGSTGIGLVPKDFPAHDFPGWRKCSAGYHSDDGQVFIERGHGEPFGLHCGNNDRMGCGIDSSSMLGVNVFFSRNGQKIGERFLHTQETLYPAVALKAVGQQVKVFLEANAPDT